MKLKVKILLLSLLVIAPLYSQGAGSDLEKNSSQSPPEQKSSATDENPFTTTHPLNRAIILGNTDEAMHLIGPGAIHIEGLIDHVLEQAVLFNNFTIATVLLEYGADPNIRSFEGLTLLHWALLTNDLEMATILLEYGADPNIAFFENFTPLHWAVSSEEPEFIKLLLEHKANPDTEFSKGVSPKHLALFFHKPEIESLLIENKRKLKSMIRGLPKNRPPELKELAGRILNIKKELSTNKNRLEDKIEIARSEVAESLLDNNTDIFQIVSNKMSSFLINTIFKFLYKMSPLHVAVVQGDKKKVQELLNKGASPYAKNKDGDTPLHLAVLKGDFEIVNSLLNKGADPNERNNDDETPLHLAIKMNKLGIAKRILKQKGVDLNARNNDGETALHLATAMDSLGLTKLLLEYGIDPNIKSHPDKADFNIEKEPEEEDFIEEDSDLVYFNGEENGETADFNIKEDMEEVDFVREDPNAIYFYVEDNSDEAYFNREEDIKGGVKAIRYAILNNNSNMTDLLIKAGTNLSFEDTEAMRILHQMPEFSAQNYAKRQELEKLFGRKNIKNCKRNFGKSVQK